jgi:hypothetical protein
MAQLQLNSLTDLADARSLLLGHEQKLLPCFLAVRTRLMAKRISDLRMHRINQLRHDLPCLVELSTVRWASHIG